MGTKQSAVEFAVNKLANLIPSGNQILIRAILIEAKEMEKQQIMESHFQGIKKTVIEVSNHITIPKTLKNVEDIENGIQKNEDGEDYYNETFNK
jgi:predicted RNA-binding protein with EMAP domain